MGTKVVSYQNYWSRCPLSNCWQEDVMEPPFSQHMVIPSILLRVVWQRRWAGSKATRLGCLTNHSKRNLMCTCCIGTRDKGDTILCFLSFSSPCMSSLFIWCSIRCIRNQPDIETSFVPVVYKLWVMLL